MNNKIYVLLLLLLISLVLACKTNRQNLGYNCDYVLLDEIPLNSLKYIENYRLKLPNNEFIAEPKNLLEAVLIYHCYSCDSSDRYAAFFYFEKEEFSLNTLIQVYENGKVINHSFNEKFRINEQQLLKISDVFIMRDCNVLGGENSILIVKDLAVDKYITYYESEGLSGGFLDLDKNYLEHVDITDNLLKLVEE